MLKHANIIEKILKPMVVIFILLHSLLYLIVILFKERDYELLQKDVEFSLMLYDTCKSIPSTILKVSG